ncbi:hypothetical protein [Acidipropionibacterium jensenii]|uniref:Uncharacterized protein n=1 Tax=Acidipropionibacterium jensenii TaxID=1749 RepID=A0A3S4YQ32_9ACTN|nr:hypothetical protein [Acidipropionibacterium jensenii]MDN5977019.1 hypothetical protein [Acidipropionibacterium jensenii]MDN5997176.1 hypothetical protein [Acidipropionibacterium jensenii]MDN6426105.1 hypothetical protein [Acidipropionibacterium jensenii]MDN6441224.1 hypothetical protein [Acidipropionibacterium jensenii]MDN6480787.1 hypothetical protein [Acidipropionibacterium jensenii]
MPGTVGGRCLRLAAVLALVAVILVLELAWRNHVWSGLERRDGQCVMVGTRVDNGNVPVVSCQRTGARLVSSVVRPSGDCQHGEEKVSVRQEMSHDTGYIGALCLRTPQPER